MSEIPLFYQVKKEETTTAKDLCTLCTLEQNGNLYDELGYSWYDEPCSCENKTFKYTYITICISEISLNKKPKECIYIISLHISKEEIFDIWNSTEHLISKFSVYTTMDENDMIMHDLLIKNKILLHIDNIEKVFIFKGIEKQQNYVYAFFEIYNFLYKLKHVLIKDVEKKVNPHYKRKERK